MVVVESRVVRSRVVQSRVVQASDFDIWHLMVYGYSIDGMEMQRR